MSTFIKAPLFYQNMACIKCKKPAKADIKHLGGSLCPACFTEIIEKRVRKSLRDNDWIKPKDKVLVIDDGTLKAKVGIHILDSIFKKTPFNITVKKVLQHSLRLIFGTEVYHNTASQLRIWDFGVWIY